MKALLIAIAILTGHECIAALRQDRDTVTGRIQVEDSDQALAVTVFITNISTNSVGIITGNKAHPHGWLLPTFSFPPGTTIQPSIITPALPVYSPMVTNILKPMVEWRVGTFMIAKPAGWDGVKRLESQLYLKTPIRDVEYIVEFSEKEEAEPDGPAKPGPPLRTPTNRTPSAVGSRP